MARRKKKKKKSLSDLPIEEAIREAMREAGRPLLLRELYHLLNIPKSERPTFRKLIKRLVKKGLLIHIKGKRYGLPESMPLVTGRLSVHPDGYAFVNPEDEKEPSVFIPPGRLKGALHGDLVVARIEKHTRKGPEGSVIRVLERGRKKIVGFFYQSHRVSTVIPEDERLPIEILIPPDRTRGAEHGDMVVAEITDFSPGRRIPEGRIVEVLGDPENLNTQAKAVIYNYDLPHRWNRRVRKELETISEEVRPEDKAGRRDLTRVPLVTIDGENARDFDDAVCVRRTRTGYKLYVAIADVSHYVPPGSALDEEAYFRGTSVYFPNMVIPMFPEKLSNGICSLNPRVERLAMTVEIDFDPEGRVRRSRFYPAVIFSHARLTYTEVKAMLVDRDRELRRKYKPLLRMLENAAELAMLLRERRLARGSIDLDLPEPEVRLDLQGEIEDIVRRERHLAHFIIEEFMIAANEAVARFLTEKGYPFLYRVHEAPEPLKLKEFVEFARSLGLDLEVPVEADPLWVQEVIRLSAGKPYAYLVNTLLLRSMKQAHYSPENIKHFGLASDCYCHFTSPIRRYPDLVVHRTLKAALKRKRPPYSYEELVDKGKHLSQRERTAMEAEREMFERVQVRFMREHIGEAFTGIISGVTAFGFFVELEEYFVSGVVRLVDLHDDYYFLDEKNHRLVGRRTGRTFRIGDRVRVRVKDVNLRRRHVTFELIEKLNGKS
ncbi:ribonuclease R [Thermosulfurimonas dismutans]|uniref:Ribonuclease R n=1 Tax=Thermosulfurimonas dismutans TaxID=999894 RepID=A0A179D5B1_9BACT|nr:ribonuclease R [Thermosulfurimonas dismutans]OAQ21275.1 3'-to-5' exoribonuclease RNase R [Thermosulfurimonas dismutans]